MPMPSGWRNPFVWQTLGGTGAAVVLTAFVFYQPWVPVEITSADTGVLVALTRESESVPKSPERAEPIEVPIAEEPESPPTTVPQKSAAIELASSPTTRQPVPQRPSDDVTWNDPGSPQENPNRWQHGTPTVAYRLPEPFLLPASESPTRWSFVIPTGVQRNLFLTGVELRPGTKSLVKNMTLSLDATGLAKRRDQASPKIGFRLEADELIPGRQILGGWSPARTPAKLPRGTAYRIPAGADLVLTVEYKAARAAANDPWSIGLHISTKAPKRELGNIEVSLPERPSSSPQTRTSAYELPTEITLYSVLPRRTDDGDAFRAYARMPTGETVPLVQDENRDPNWNGFQVFSAPLDLPKGATIVLETDDPSAAIGTFQVATKEPAHLPPLLRHNRLSNFQR